MKHPSLLHLQGPQTFPGKEYMQYYLNHYTHKLIYEGQFRREWLISKEEFLISNSGLTAAHPPAAFRPDQDSPRRRIKRRGGWERWGSEEKKK